MLVTACSNPEPPRFNVNKTPSETEHISVEDVQEEAQDAVETAGAYTLEKRQDYQEKIESQLNEFERRIDNLQAKAATAEAETQQKLNDEIQSLKDERDAIARQLTDLKTASSDAWDELSSGIDQAMKDLQSSYERALTEFNQTVS
jgi:predicted nuclease with TOPRIM domain